MNAQTAPRKQRRIISDKIDLTKPAAIIVQKAGGLTNFCRDYDFPLSTVQSWMVSGFIPSRRREAADGSEISYHAWILQRSAELRHKIKPEDFIEQVAG